MINNFFYPLLVGVIIVLIGWCLPNKSTGTKIVLSAAVIAICFLAAIVLSDNTTIDPSGSSQTTTTGINNGTINNNPVYNTNYNTTYNIDSSRSTNYTTTNNSTSFSSSNTNGTTSTSSSSSVSTNNTYQNSSAVSDKGVALEYPQSWEYFDSPFYMYVNSSKKDGIGSIYLMPKPESGNGNLGKVYHGKTVTILAERNGYYFFETSDGRLGWNGKVWFVSEKP